MKLNTYQTPYGTFGEITCERNRHICYTVERLYKDNKPFISCIPRNHSYELIPFTSERYGKTYALENSAIGIDSVKDQFSTRYGILIHPANHHLQLQGCIAPGTKLGLATNPETKALEWGVNFSKVAHNVLMDYLEESGDRILTITSQ